MTTTPDPFDSLEASLVALTHALVSGDPDRVLAAESEILSATSRLAAMRPLPGEFDAAYVRRRARAIQEAILRCRALGLSADALRRVLVPGLAYTGTGRPGDAGFATVNSRV